MTDINKELRIVNLGLEGFYNDLVAQGTPSVQIDWRPPAEGNENLIGMLCDLQKAEVEEANQATIDRMKQSRPLWVDVCPAIEAIPGLEPDTLLHSGPPTAPPWAS